MEIELDDELDFIWGLGGAGKLEKFPEFITKSG
jgi:hypothetical protein